MEQPGRIFMIDNGGKTDGRYQSLLEEHGYEVFATNNAYQLIRYAEELHPQLYVVDKNAEDVDARQVLNYLSSNRYLDEAPAVMLNAESTQEMVKGASHYVSAKENGQMLVDIADAYCRGGRGYKVLLLEDYLPYSANEFNAMEEFRISYFKVYDAQGAKMFLQRNAPQAVIIHCQKEEYNKIRGLVGFENTFYVENRGNMEKLVSFLK